MIASLELVEIDAVVLDRAAQPMPTELGMFDAIHLATALLWREMAHMDLLLSIGCPGLFDLTNGHGAHFRPFPFA